MTDQSGPSIREVTGFQERVAAVDLATRVGRPDIPEEQRLRRAITYAVPSMWVAICTVDVEIDGEMHVLPRRYPAPVFGAYVGRRLIGGAVCSCDSPGLPVRLMMLAVDPDWQGQGVGSALVARVLAGEAVIGVAAPNSSLEGYYQSRGFSEWHNSIAGCRVGFTRPVDAKFGLIFVVPAATDDQISDGLACHRHNVRAMGKQNEISAT
jgi:GNAT superfamily N-acetyltransferase